MKEENRHLRRFREAIEAAGGPLTKEAEALLVFWATRPERVERMDSAPAPEEAHLFAQIDAFDWTLGAGGRPHVSADRLWAFYDEHLWQSRAATKRKLVKAFGDCAAELKTAIDAGDWAEVQAARTRLNALALGPPTSTGYC